MSKMLYQNTDFISELYFIFFFFLANFKDRRILLSVGILDILKSTEIGEKTFSLGHGDSFKFKFIHQGKKIAMKNSAE